MFGREEKVPAFRLTIVQYVILAIFLILAFGLWRLQVARNDYYSSLAEQNRIKQVPILAPRGKILDREGRIIVDNYPSFSVLMLRDQRRDLFADVPMIADGLHLDPEELGARIKRIAASPGYQPLFVKDDITPDELAWVEAHKAELPELDTITVHRRLYPKDGFMAHLIGYVGEVSEDMLNSPKWELYNPGDIVGKSGVELQYNDILMGKNGSRQVLVNSKGKEVGTLSDVAAEPGKQLKLTIDLDVQIAAEQALGDSPGAIIALDPHTGEILAMVSRPVFDPNAFSVRVSRQEWNRLLSDESKPLLNKAIQAQLAPGSTFKVIMSVAGLQEGIAQNLVVNCAGGGDFYGRFFKCDQHHGSVNISKAIYDSCDTYYYTLGEKLGIGKIAFYASEFGLGKKTGVDLPQEVSGIMPSEEWKAKNYKQKWFAGETISVSIGQGAVAATPIQLARALGGIAMGGELHTPHVAFPNDLPQQYQPVAEKSGEVEHIRIDPENWQVITDAMADVTKIGTASAAHLNGIDFAGKTGTAQTISMEARSKLGAEGKKKFSDNAWFVGMAPRRDPQIVVAVLYQGGGWGWHSGLLAAQVIKAYVEKQRKVQKNPTLYADAPGKAGSVEMSALWHDGDGSDQLQGARFRVPVARSRIAAKAAPGMESDLEDKGGSTPRDKRAPLTMTEPKRIAELKSEAVGGKH
ncbi:peptidoglycan glycosyltransferase [Candidatus Koribacter versatilis Ellin345]|uniref:Peptidoglycan glycosyltransferase n=1 Tax=Koribacter versatilis (strain Ellin345) TaxID=204669 RepID=Q1IRN3_KORVE|nr:penicillin-binding protein 2 [Candidatus Koribacter versatilis]ABF40467.1 peptidoglycan glycosyltransferase [Candidatus Koribacter versatilis Ellin345]